MSYIKIDVDFVRELTDDPADRQVVSIETIAEGVESADTLSLLTEMGVDYAQGFHIGRPAPVG